MTPIVYEGKWVSDNSSQNNYIKTNSGGFWGLVEILSNNKVRLSFQIYQNQYIDGLALQGFVDVDLISEDQSKFEVNQEQDLIQRKSLFISNTKNTCTFNVNFELVDKINNRPIAITSDNIANANFIGLIKSHNCSLDLRFDSKLPNPDILKAYFFTVIQICMALLGTFPLYKILKLNQNNKILIISEWTFIFNIMIDFSLLVVNFSFSIKFLVEYFDFLNVVTLCFLASIWFKIKFLLYAKQIRESDSNLTPELRARKKFLLKLKFMGLFIISMVCGILFVELNLIFYILYAYPLLQIVFNLTGVARENCFLWKLHLPFFISQVFYPIFMKGTSYSFFKLYPDELLGPFILCEILFLFGVLFLQKSFGACFFLPKCFTPNYFNYFRKFSCNKVQNDENCPICFCGLMENPDDSFDFQNLDSKKNSLLPLMYMETPCKHKFHISCLKIWMNKKMICPCCRASLPPII